MFTLLSLGHSISDIGSVCFELLFAVCRLLYNHCHNLSHRSNNIRKIYLPNKLEMYQEFYYVPERWNYRSLSSHRIELLVVFPVTLSFNWNKITMLLLLISCDCCVFFDIKVAGHWLFFRYLAALISQSFLDIGSVSRILDGIMKLCLQFCWKIENDESNRTTSELEHIAEVLLSWFILLVFSFSTDSQQ